MVAGIVRMLYRRQPASEQRSHGRPHRFLTVGVRRRLLGRNSARFVVLVHSPVLPHGEEMEAAAGHIGVIGQELPELDSPSPTIIVLGDRRA